MDALLVRSLSRLKRMRILGLHNMESLIGDHFDRCTPN